MNIGKKSGFLTALVFSLVLCWNAKAPASETFPVNPEPGALFVAEGNIFEYSLQSKIIEDSGWLDMKSPKEPTAEEKRVFVDRYMESHPQIMRDEVMVIVYEVMEKDGSWHIRLAGFDKKLEEKDQPEKREL